MSFILPAAALSPLVLCLSGILIFRLSSLVGALLGIGLSLLLIFGNIGFPVNPAGFSLVFGQSAILILSAALVIIPGIYFNAILREQGIIDGIVNWVHTIRIEAEMKVLILLLGILPAVEALTGFGVSLFLAVPLFFRLAPPERAFRLSMLALCTVSWGSLALPTVVAATLTGYTVRELGSMSAQISCLVFPALALSALYVMGKMKTVRRFFVPALLTGACLSLLLYAFNAANLVEVSSLFAGFLTSLFGFTLAWQRVAHLPRPAVSHVTSRSRLALFVPWALVLVLLLAQRGIPPLHDFLANLLILSAGRVKLVVFNSPGWMMMLTIVFLLVHYRPTIGHKVIWQRIRLTLAALSCFVLLGQLMNESQMIAAITAILPRDTESQGLVLMLSALIGIMSGFVSGSNVGANALMIGMQQQIGETTGQGLLFSALQNSAAGHAIFTSLPVIVLIMAIVRDSMGEIKDDTGIAESDLLLFGLKIILLIWAALVSAAAMVVILIC